MERGPSFNPFSFSALRHLETSQAAVNDHLRRLSSGLRIERASDDPAGLGVSERMRARLGSQEVAQRNLQDGISLLRTAESTLSGVTEMLSRMRELAVGALNGTASSVDLDTLQSEFGALAEEVRRQVKGSTYNGIELLTRDQVIQIQAGADADDRIDLKLSNLTGMGFVLQTLDISSAADLALDAIDFYSDLTSLTRAELGAQENRLGSALRSVGSDQVNLAAALSRIRDVDIASETAELVSAQIRRDMSLSMLIRAQSQPLGILKLLDGALGVLNGSAQYGVGGGFDRSA